MRRLHAFDVRFAGRRQVYRGEIWAAKDGRLLVRFNCPTESDYDEAHEIRGLNASDLSQAELDANPGKLMMFGFRGCRCVSAIGGIYGSVQ